MTESIHAENKAKRNVLNIKAKLQIGSYLTSKREDIIASGASYDQIAAKATTELGYLITGANVKSIADAVGLPIGRSVLKESMDLKEDFKKIIEILDMFYIHANLPVPCTLQELKQKYGLLI